MVSSKRAPRRPSRDRLVAAAAHEFAARGFDGAKVDRIAARAGVNKAMIYYHFRNKAALYREVVRDLFSAVQAAVTEARGEGGPAVAQVAHYIRAVATTLDGRPHFPAIWLREMADGGRHLNAEIHSEMAQVVRTLGAILGDGRRDGVFGPANPLVVHLGIVAPLVLYAASAEIREQMDATLPGTAAVSPDAVRRQVEAATLAVLGYRATGRRRGAASGAGPGATPPRSRRRRRS